MTTRRGLFKKTLGGAVLLAAAGAVPVALRRTKVRATPAQLGFFSPAEFSIWAAMADRILAVEATAATRDPSPLPISPQTAPPAGLGGAEIAAKADAFLSPLPGSDRKELKQLLALFDNALASFVSGGPARPFTEMSAEDQDAHLRSWQTSRIGVKRTGFQAMKRLCCALYYSDPATYASVGYPGPPVELVRSVLQKGRP